MRADRLLSLLMLLQTRGQMSAMELAEELEVSERTIYRDITALSTSGVPIYASRGPGGGVRLIEEYHRITYAVPFGILGDAVNYFWIAKRLQHIFEYRRYKITELFGDAK